MANGCDDVLFARGPGQVSGDALMSVRGQYVWGLFVSRCEFGRDAALGC